MLQPLHSVRHLATLFGTPKVNSELLLCLDIVMSAHGHSHGGQPCHGHSHSHAHSHSHGAAAAQGEEDNPAGGISGAAAAAAGVVATDEEDDGSFDETVKLNVDDDNRVVYEGDIDLSFQSYANAVELGSPEEKTALLTDCAHAMSARAKGIGTSEGATYFIKASDEPRCTLEALAQQIFNFHAAGAVFDPSRSGAEWWTQVIDAEDDIGFHWDKDFALEEYGLNLHPHLASVTYLNESFVGAPTVVFAKRSCEAYGDDFGGGVSKAWVSFPSGGKHMAFDGQLLHGAPSNLRVGPTAGTPSDGGGGGAKKGKGADAETESDKGRENESDEESEDSETESAAMDLIADSVSKGTTVTRRALGSDGQTTRQLRVTFLVNVWLNHIPLMATPLPDEVLQNISCGRTLDTPGIKVNLAAGVSQKDDVKMLGCECKACGLEEIDPEAEEPGLPRYEFNSDEQDCMVFVRIPLLEICQKEFAAGHLAFGIDLGELPDSDDEADVENAETEEEVEAIFEQQKQAYLKHLLAEFVCDDMDEAEYDDFPAEPDFEAGFEDETTESDGSTSDGEDDDAPAMDVESSPVVDIFGEQAWDGATPNGDPAPFANLYVNGARAKRG